MCVCACVFIHAHILVSSLHIYLSMDSCFHVFTIINNATLNTNVQIFFKLVFSFHLYIFPEGELLRHIVVLFLILGETSILFSTVAIPIYTSSAERSSFLYTHTSICYLLFFVFFFLNLLSFWWKQSWQAWDDTSL